MAEGLAFDDGVLDAADFFDEGGIGQGGG